MILFKTNYRLEQIRIQGMDKSTNEAVQIWRCTKTITKKYKVMYRKLESPVASQPTLGTIWKEKQRILENYEKESAKVKRIKYSSYDEVDSKLYFTR